MQSHLAATTPTAAPPRRVSRRLSPSAAIPLSQLVCGTVALFEGADLPESEMGILAAVGLQDGATLQVRQGGESCVIQVGTTRLALAGPAAHRILVRPLGPSGDG
jgi:hypothetical protein